MMIDAIFYSSSFILAVLIIFWIERDDPNH